MYNDSYFYVLSFPNPNSIEKDDFSSLFCLTGKEIIIKTEKIDDSVFFLESPMRLYQSKDKNMLLLR